ncbi:hypothetical protein CC1G_15522 [Coprinopsis cinerea okayama7|uniref:Uncharacterized protein n=1 Tax=Coprinopsis cinerea (strain Okayama-7 / 130 / ATCC MYA-4618 / FGSC 9003) TaxID=240176 RepID=D6RNA3_COPC7|nr:hypothetical protein CC1G_15522 [Coprinopsis cinerea okayama7\|eukprot:XP_002910981.1 hypothetical protein CC1G_15522 [Coprinopsis cinerea okayama7\
MSTTSTMWLGEIRHDMCTSSWVGWGKRKITHVTYVEQTNRYGGVPPALQHQAFVRHAAATFITVTPFIELKCGQGDFTNRRGSGN